MIHDARERDVEAASLVPKKRCFPTRCCCWWWWWCSPVVLSMEDTTIVKMRKMNWKKMKAIFSGQKFSQY